MPITRIRIDATGQELGDVTRCLDVAAEAILREVPGASHRDEDVISRDRSAGGWKGRCSVYVDIGHILQPDSYDGNGAFYRRYVAEPGSFDKGQVAWWAVFDRNAPPENGSDMLIGELTEQQAHGLADLLETASDTRTSLLIDRWLEAQRTGSANFVWPSPVDTNDAAAG